MGRHERTLRHLSFFEALGSGDEGSAEWRASAAGLVVLRLVDAWVEEGAAVAGDGAEAIAAVREALAAVPEADPIHTLLDSILGALRRSAPGDLSLVSPRLLAYGRALDFAGRWPLAVDVYRVILDHAHPFADADVVTHASLRLGYCSRVLGDWAGARAAYERAEEIARASGDEGAVLRSLVGRANLARDRGNLPEAEAILDDVLARAPRGELGEVRRIALHDRSTVACVRGDLAGAVRLAHEALALSGQDSGRDRILADIGTYFAEMGVRSAARDAHLIVALTAQEQYQRWSSQLALLELAVLDGAERAFEAHRRALAGAALPPELAVVRQMYEARGEAAFGRAAEAVASARRALDLARESGQHRHAFEAEALLERLTAPARRRARGMDPTPAPAPVRDDALPGELAEVASELASMRALAEAV